MGKTLTDVNNQWEVLHADGTTIELNSRANVSCVTKAEQTCELGSGDIVTLTVLAANPINFKLGDRFVIFGQTYKLNQLPQVKKTGSKAFEYTLSFEGVQYELIDKTWLLPDDTVRDSYTGDLAAFMAILADNANRNSEVTWSVGECPTGTEYKTLTYSDKNCLEVLQALCEEYGLEFSITQTTTTRVIDLKTKVGETLSYTFKYGRNGGAYSIERTNNDSSNVVTRLYVYGSTDNLGSKYRHTRLCLPNKAKNQSYVEDADKTALYGSREAFKTFDDIRPERVGTVSGVSSSDPMTFYDKDMFELTASENGSTKYLIDGTTAKVTFQTGDLAGYEFEIASYIHKDKRFILSQFEDENGYQFPSSTFKPKVGDTYVLSDIVLPQTYIDTAEAKLLTKANEQLAETSEPNVTYAVQLDETFLSEMVADGTANIFRVGDSVKITDADLGIDANIRIQSFTRDCINPYKYNLTLSDTSTPTTLQRVVGSIDRTSQAVEVQSKINAKEARLRYQAMEELKGLVFDPEGNYYSDKIAPLSIDTTMLTVGSRSQQLSVSGILFSPNAWDGTTENPNVLKITTAGAGVLTHYTIADTPRSWSLSSITFTGLTSTSAYYIYAKCNQAAGDTGAVLMVDTAQRTVDSDPSGQVWYFLLGTLSSVIDGLRVINLTYGQTTVNGSFITTGVISSIDGGTTFNLNTGEIKGNISFSASSTTDENRRWVDSLLGYSTDKSAMQVDISNAQSTANSASSTANSAKSKVDNMKVGGRNLCRGTGTAKSGTMSETWKQDFYIGSVTRYLADVQVKAGGSMTVSFDIKSSAAVTMGAVFPSIRGSKHRTLCNGGGLPAFTAGETKHMSFTGTVGTIDATNWETPIVTTDYWMLNIQTKNNVTTTFTISNFKVELGNVATDWTPAPEDVDAAITAAKKAAIEGVDVMYALGTSSTTAPTSGWSTDAPKWEKGKYMWQRTDIKTGDGTTKAGEATCIQGAAGENGESGVGITGYKEWYYLSSSSTSCTGGTWQATQPTWSAGKYVWTQTEVFYDNGTTSHTEPLLSNLFNVANQAAKDASDAAELANTTANSALTNSSTALTTANSAKSKVDNMRVGGRNLCRGTGTAKSWSSSTSGNVGVAPYKASAYIVAQGLKNGDEVTVSFDMTSSVAATIGGDMWINLSGSAYRTVGYAPKDMAFTAGETKHIAVACTLDMGNWNIPLATGDVWGWGMQATDVTTTFTISNFKVELGNVATDWTPAPEDVDSDINAANEKIAQAMSLAATAGNLFNDQFLLSNCTANAPEPPTGLARLCNNRNNYFGTAFSVEPSMKVTVEMIIRRHDDDATDLIPEIGLWYWSSDGTASWQHVAYSDLGAASMDGMWYRVRSTFTITGADLATAKRPQTAKVYVWMNKTASTGDGVNSAGAFWVSNIVVLCTQYDYLEDALKETSSTTTDVQGGLVLGKMIAMRNTINGSEAWVAGLNGCSMV